MAVREHPSKRQRTGQESHSIQKNGRNIDKTGPTHGSKPTSGLAASSMKTTHSGSLARLSDTNATTSNGSRNMVPFLTTGLMFTGSGFTGSGSLKCKEKPCF